MRKEVIAWRIVAQRMTRIQMSKICLIIAKALTGCRVVACREAIHYVHRP